MNSKVSVPRRSILKAGAVAAGGMLTGCRSVRKSVAVSLRQPAMLFCSPADIDSMGCFYVDLDYLRELHAHGFQVDYTNSLKEVTWDRIRRYNVLVLNATPDAWVAMHTFGASSYHRTAFVALINRYVQAGGGVLLMPEEYNCIQQMLAAIADGWGAKWPLETIVETSPANRGSLRHAAYPIPLAYTDEVPVSPVSAGVHGVWYPNAPASNGAMGGPVVVDSHWQVVLRASHTAHSQPINLKTHNHLPPNAYQRRGPVPQPALMAIRELGAGRAAILNQWPQFSVGSGTKWIYDRQVLSAGCGDKPSDFGRLLENTWRWLAAPSLATGAVGGYVTGPTTLMAPNIRKFRNGQLAATGQSATPQTATFQQGLYRGLMGAKTTYSSGRSTVEEYAAAAKKAGLHFVIFLDDFADLTPQRWAALRADCARHSDNEVLLLPGFTMDANTGDHMFFYTTGDGPGGHWPPPSVRTGPGKALLNLQPQNAAGKYIGRNGPSFPWMYLSWIAHKGNHGYYHFSGQPPHMRISDLRLYAMAAIRYYRNGRLVEDNTADYLTTSAGTVPPAPVSFNEVRSVQELAREVESGNALTYVQASAVPNIFNEGLWWANQFVSYNTFLSDGPMIHAWPQTSQVWALGAADFVTQKSVMAAPIDVRSSVGLKEIAIYNGEELFRRFLPGGAATFKQTLLLDASIQRNLVLVATDVKGEKAVSFARRCWKDGTLAPMYCDDHVNSTVMNITVAHGPISMCVTNPPTLPPQIAGITWDGGPPALIPLVTFAEGRPDLQTDLGDESGARFENTPMLDYTDAAAGALASRQNWVFAADVVNVYNPWNTWGPLAGPSRLMEFTQRFTQVVPPSLGIPELGSTTDGLRVGISAGLFRLDVRFKRDCEIQQLLLVRNDYVLPPAVSRVNLIFGAGPGHVTREMAYFQRGAGRQTSAELRLGRGDWFALCSPDATCSHVFIVRQPGVRVWIGYPQIKIFADSAGKRVRAGDSCVLELFSLGVPANMGIKTSAGVTRLLAYLAEPEGLQVVLGDRIDSPGFVECVAHDGAVELSAPRPSWKTNLSLPLRIKGLNRRWSAGVLQEEGYVALPEAVGANRYRAMGIDEFGCGYVPLYVDLAPRTHVLAGHPIIADAGGGELFINVVPTPGGGEGGVPRWQVSVNNPTDKAISATLRQAMRLPGLAFRQARITLAPGEYRVLA